MADLIADFTDHLAHTRRLSLHTVAAYGRDLTAFAHFLKAHSGAALTSATLKGLAARDIEAWLAAGLRRGQNKTSLNRALATLRTFARWAEETHGLTLGTITGFKGLKAAVPPPKALNLAQTWDLLE